MSNTNYAGRPSVCQNCGALVGASETSCSACGAAKDVSGDAAAVAQPQAQTPVYDRETIRFAHAILSRPYIFTIIFLAANVFVFLLMWSSSDLTTNTLWEPPVPVLLAYGAKLNYLINYNQEWWRFVTPIFIHIGAAHLLINMYGLWMLGPYVERLYGSAKFVVLWVATGVAGVVASYFCVRPDLAVGPVGRFLFRNGDGPSAGASGALFGLVGVLFVFGIKFRSELPEGFKRAFGTGLVPVILLNLVIGYAGSGFIDNAAHLGGLLSGALFGLLIKYKRPGENAGVSIFWHILQVLALALVAVSFLMVGLNFNKNYPALADVAPHSAIEDDSGVNDFQNAVNGGQSAFVAAVYKGDPGGLDEAIKALEKAGSPDKRSGELRDELRELLARARDYAALPAKSVAQQRARAQRQIELDERFESWETRFHQWVKIEGQDYGLRLQEPPTENDSSEKK